MKDEELADVIIERLNKLIQDPAVRADIRALIECRLKVSDRTCEHPTIQVNDGTLGFLGLLNGIVGVIPEGKHTGYGFISAIYDDHNELCLFARTTC